MRAVARMVRWLAILGAVILVVAGGSVYFWWKAVSGAVDANDHQKVAVTVPKGVSVAEVGRILGRAGVIRDLFIFRVASHLRARQATIMPGDYLLSKDLTVAQVFEVLENGPADSWVTIPEGWRREQVAVKLEGILNVEGKKRFDAKKFLTLTGGLEGKLFPDTYLIPQGASEGAIVKIMADNYRKRTTGILAPPFPAGLTDREVIVLSSIVERETTGDENERAIVAGILIKRLESGWPLQADATLQYARDSAVVSRGTYTGYKFWQPIFEDDRKVDSVYNTYLHAGLPPTAIANPGLTAIKAVMAPKETNYWYYLHGNDGVIHFAVTEREHLQNIAKYLNP